MLEPDRRRRPERGRLPLMLKCWAVQNGAAAGWDVASQRKVELESVGRVGSSGLLAHRYAECTGSPWIPAESQIPWRFRVRGLVSCPSGPEGGVRVFGGPAGCS